MKLVSRKYSTEEKLSCPPDAVQLGKRETIHCPVNGIIFSSFCRDGGGMSRDGCPFYKGDQEISDLMGEKYSVIICSAWMLFRRENP